jgi:hypothetical protein
MFDNSVQVAIEARTQMFVQEIASLVRKAALNSVQEALRGSTAGFGSPRAAGLLPAPGRAPQGKRIRRTAARLSEVAEILRAEIERRPGLRIEQLAKQLRTTTKSLARPAKMLIAEGRVTTRGQKRATQYFPVEV